MRGVESVLHCYILYKPSIYKGLTVTYTVFFCNKVCYIPRRIKPMLEKDITNKILKYLKSLPECYCFKEHGGSYGSSGIPDIICCFHGLFLAFEVKTAKGKTTALQDINIRKINVIYFINA